MAIAVDNFARGMAQKAQKSANGVASMIPATFIAIADGTTHIPHNLNYVPTTDLLEVYGGEYNSLLTETNPISYTENADNLSIDLVGWSVNIGDVINFKLTKNVAGDIIGGIENLTTQNKTNLVSAINEGVSALADIVQQVNKADIIDGDITNALKALILAIQTSEFTEATPSQNAKGKILIPAGIYKITSKITIPSYISLEGNGRNTTILQSYITNGDSVLEVKQGDGSQRQFYNSIKGLSIEGRGQACRGISIVNTSRWILDDVSINNTLNEGLYLYNCCLGEIRSCLVRACGDATHFSAKYDGPNSNAAPNGVTWFGGEINGGGTSVSGLHIKYGNTVSFFGTSIEGFANGLGLLNENGIVATFIGCHFEANKGHIENTLAYNPVYVGNFFSVPTTGAIGHIIINNIYGGKIEGNFFAGTGFTHIVAKDASSVIAYSSIIGNYVSAFPIIIDSVLKTSALNSGTIIETYDANGFVLRYGQHRYSDTVEFLGALKPIGGIKSISGFTRCNITAGTGTPEGMVTASPSSLYLREDGTTDSALYLKNTGLNSLYGWLPIQTVHSGTTATRPTVTLVGYQYFDSTLGKPIWWNGVFWKDASGATV